MWSLFTREIAQNKASLGGALDDARVQVENGRLVLIFSSTFNADMVQRSLDVLKPVMIRHFGAAVPFEGRVEKPAAPASKPPSRAAAPPVGTPETFIEAKADEAGADVQRALKHFPGTVKKERR